MVLHHLQWLFFWDFVTICVFGERLNEYINNYDIVKYQHIQREGRITKINFRAFNRDFRLILSPGNSVIDVNARVVAYGLTRITKIPLSDVSNSLVNGKVEGVNDSRVFGKITRNVFEGVIKLPDEIYQVELAKYYFNRSTDFDLVIHRKSDLKVKSFLCPKKENKSLNFQIDRTSDVKNSSSIFKNILRRRSVNESEKSIRESYGNVCTLRIFVDHLYYGMMIPRTFSNTISSVSNVIAQVDEMYRSYDFNQDGSPDNVGFKIVDFVIFWSRWSPGYQHGWYFLPVEKYLERVSYYKTSDVCLALMFSARNYNPVLGVAVLRSQEYSGICAKIFGFGRNYNVGFVTMKIGRTRLPNSFVALIAAHEIGHSFGSSHDPEECQPRDRDNYLMFAAAPNFRSPNSLKLSTCSLTEIYSKMQELGIACFKSDSELQTCGNGLVENDEQCDCGRKSQCKIIDKCCTSSCTYKTSKGAQCSSVSDKCCTSKCKIASKNRQCSREEECKNPSFCDGDSKDCPVATNKPDETECGNGFGVCTNGTCQAKACKKFNTEQCTPLINHCYLHCLRDGWCIAAKKIGIKNEDGTHYLPNGFPCEDGSGKCKRGVCIIMKSAMNNGKKIKQCNYITNILLQPIFLFFVAYFRII